MADALVFDRTCRFLGEALKISARRHSLISANVVNIDTIGYKPKGLDFEETLAKAMAEEPQSSLNQTHPRHFSDVDSFRISMDETTEDDADAYHLDSVDIDKEMTLLAENSIKYRSATEMLLRKLGMLRYAITEGGR